MNNILIDKDMIRELIAEYCFLLDASEFEKLGNLFTVDGIWKSRNGKARGPAAIENLLRKIVLQREAIKPRCGIQRMHLTTNIIVKIDGNNAEACSNFLIVRQTSSTLISTAAGTYTDLFSRQSGVWLFSSRLLTHDMMESPDSLAASP
jgi:hypothetical protein